MKGSPITSCSRLFFSLKNDIEIHSQLNLLRPEFIKCCQQRHDRRLVIRGGTRVEPPIVVIDRPMLRTVFREGNPLPTRFNSSIAKDWLERFSIRQIGRASCRERV